MELEATSVGQWLVSRPIILGPLLGIFIQASAGRLWESAQMGLWVEFLLLDVLPVGGVVPPNGALAVAGAILLQARGVPDPVCFFLGIGLGWGFVPVETWIRQYRVRFSKSLEDQFRDFRGTGIGILKVLLKSLILQFLVVFLFLLVGLAVAGPTAIWLWGVSPEVLREGLQRTYEVVPWIGMATLFWVLRPR
ncbi:MAG: PTS sugar transporter subunit IIC [Elusimicrobia bacterium]|nr:PTS sugar transporter subunit IIC [Elusimicrobiota bacterium]